MKQYKPAEGLTAENRDGALQLAWQGERGDQLRASFTIREGQPMVVELAARGGSGAWKILGRNLTPEYELTSGVRRMSEQQLGPLREMKAALTPELIEREKWNAFWDAPLSMRSPVSRTALGFPRISTSLCARIRSASLPITSTRRPLVPVLMTSSARISLALLASLPLTMTSPSIS